MARILIFVGYFRPHVGGNETMIYELSRRLVARGYDVDVVTCNTESVLTTERMDGVCVYRLPSWDLLGGVYPVPRPSPTTFKMLWELWRKKHDIVQTVNRFAPTSFIGLLISKVKRVPLAHTEVGSRHSVVQSRLVGLINRLYDHTIGSLVVRSASALMTNCEAGALFLRHLGARRAVAVIPTTGVDKTFFTRRGVNLRDGMGLNEATVITCISRLIFAKGVQDLITAFPRIRQEVPSAKLVIVGDGPYRQELEKMAKETDSENIVFVGQIVHERIPEVLSITDVLVNPSYSEALTAYPVLEAGAMGIPSVTTDVGGTGEIVEDYRTGLLVSPGDVDALADRVTLLLRDKELREKLGAEFRQVILERFDWDSVVQRYCAEVERVLKK